jgi:L,D-peptidoglycan transpeptidase YkuD (ErfK/YbiS/YcfS/YnhG family)
MFPNVKIMNAIFEPLFRSPRFLFSVILLSFLFSLLSSPASVAQIEDANQLVLVVSPTWNSNFGTMYLFERDEDGWTQYNIPWRVSLADSGLAWGIGLHTIPAGEREKVEGDRRSPAGVFELGDFFGYDSIPPPHIRYPYRQATKLLHCVDDTSSVFYNSFVGEDQVVKDSAGRLPWKSSETMRLDSLDYKYGIIVRHNPNALPGKGSCIFLHVGRFDSSATSGCTSMDEKKILFLMQWLDPVKHPRLVQLPAEAFRRYLIDWDLPLLLKN